MTSFSRFRAQKIRSLIHLKLVPYDVNNVLILVSCFYKKSAKIKLECLIVLKITSPILHTPYIKNHNKYSIFLIRYRTFTTYNILRPNKLN